MMLRTIICTIAMLVIAIATSAAPKTDRGDSTSNEYRFIGYTDDATNLLSNTIAGDRGMIAMHVLCQDDFGPDARMCIGREFWLSLNAKAPSTESAWLQHGTDPSSSAVGGIGLLNCNGWTSTLGFSGSVVTTDGKPSTLTCNAVSRPVTCCAPLQ